MFCQNGKCPRAKANHRSEEGQKTDRQVLVDETKIHHFKVSDLNHAFRDQALAKVSYVSEWRPFSSTKQVRHLRLSYYFWASKSIAWRKDPRANFSMIWQHRGLLDDLLESVLNLGRTLFSVILAFKHLSYGSAVWIARLQFVNKIKYVTLRTPLVRLVIQSLWLGLDTNLFCNFRLG